MTNQNVKWSVIELVNILKETAELDKDNMIPVDGGTGTGKSTLALKMCRKACPWFDMQRDILYSRDEIMEWIATAQPGSWGLADEAVNALFKRDFGTKGQKFLLKILDMCRSRNLTLLLCIPNFWALDSHILQGRVRLRIHVNSTGHAFLWKPSGNPFAPDKWFRKYNEKVCWGWDRSMASAVRTKGYVGEVEFGDLTPEVKAEYVKIKEEKKRMIKEQEDKANAKEDEDNRKYAEFVKQELIYWLNKRGNLRPGWLHTYSSLEKIDYLVIKQRVSDFAKKYAQNGEDEKISLFSSPPKVTKDIVYTNNNNTNNLNNPPQQDNIEQYDEQEPKEDDESG